MVVKTLERAAGNICKAAAFCGGTLGAKGAS
jgi:hypothetical protein